MASAKKIIGLLGGIGAGKSTVAHCFAELGCAVIEADILAHQALEKSDIKERIVRLFGTGILDSNGRINRRALGRMVFSDKTALDNLTAVIHPWVMGEVERLIEVYGRDVGVKAVVLDVPLLAEAGGEKLCDVLIFVDASEAVRRERVKKSGKFDENELKKRENFQISLDKKRRMSDYVLCNNSDISDVAEQVAQLFSTITGNRQLI